MFTDGMREFEGDYILADNVWDETVWVWRRTGAPKGCKVEIVEGLITVTPLSSVAHNGVAERVQRRLYDVIPEDWGVYRRLPLAVPVDSVSSSRTWLWCRRRCCARETSS
jgi:hypothetical protein